MGESESRSAVVDTAVHDCDPLIELFNGLFVRDCNTKLVGGGEEPVYLPGDADNSYHRVIFAHDYFASALHEISHWCIAGPQRRLREDFGYWYRPDGRTAEQQAEFELVEVKPQALEWMLARACGFKFRISCDNLSGEDSDSSTFKDRVYQQVLAYLSEDRRVLDCKKSGLSKRAGLLLSELCRFYRQPELNQALFSRAALDW